MRLLSRVTTVSIIAQFTLFSKIPLLTINKLQRFVQPFQIEPPQLIGG